MAEFKTEHAHRQLNYENRYSPDAIFSRLTADDLPHSIILGNNLLEIRKHNYDPLLTLETKVKSDLLENHDSGKSGNTMVASFKARMEVRTGIDELKPQDFAAHFTKMGLHLDYKEIVDPEEGNIPQECFVSPEGAAHPIKIRFFDVSYGIYTMMLSVPAQEIPLVNTKKFEADQKAFFDDLAKVIETVYEMEDKIPHS